MRTARFRSVVLFLPIAVLVATEARPPSFAEMAHNILLDMTTLRSSCGEFTCSTVCLVSTDHKVVQDGGSDGGGDHDCLATDLGCSYHDCNGLVISLHDLERLMQLLPQLDGQELIALGSSDLGLLINRDRGALQVLGCNDLVVASVPLSLEQVVWLEAAESS